MLRQPVILFDGVCNLCNGLVQFVIARDTKAVYKFGALQSKEAAALLSGYDLPAKYLNSIVLIKDGSIFYKSDAVLQIVRNLKGWKWFYSFRFIPLFIRNCVYDVIAKYRYRIFGRRNECMLPDESIRQRFI